MKVAFFNVIIFIRFFMFRKNIFYYKVLNFCLMVGFSQIGYSGVAGEIKKLAETDLYPAVNEIAKAGGNIKETHEIAGDIRKIVERASEKFDSADLSETKRGMFYELFYDATIDFLVTPPPCKGFPQERLAEEVRDTALMFLSGGDQTDEVLEATYRTIRDKYTEVSNDQFDGSVLPLLGLKSMLQTLVNGRLPK